MKNCFRKQLLNTPSTPFELELEVEVIFSSAQDIRIAELKI